MADRTIQKPDEVVKDGATPAKKPQGDRK